jgi:hypothetical protein
MAKRPEAARVPQHDPAKSGETALVAWCSAAKWIVD